MVDISKTALTELIKNWNPLNLDLETYNYDREINKIIEITKPLAILTPTLLALRIQNVFEYYFGEKGKINLNEIRDKIASELFPNQNVIIRNSENIPVKKFLWFDQVFGEDKNESK